MNLAVSEIFGPTFQGEGKFAGTRTAFLRLAGCNLHCSWCDTPYTWDWTGRNGKRYSVREESKVMHISEVCDSIDRLQCKHLVITGGEPMLQQDALAQMLRGTKAEYEVEIETNGTITPKTPLYVQLAHLDVSPKLSNSGMPREMRIKPQVLWDLGLRGKASFKFVCTNEKRDLDEVDEIVYEIYGNARFNNIWIMPEGRDARTILATAQALAPEVLARGYNMTLRMQTLLWGAERGR